MDDPQAADNPWDLISRPGDSPPQQSATDKLLGRNGPRYQLWPERVARDVISGVVSGVTLPGDAIEYARERQREFERTGHITMSDSDVGPVNIKRMFDLATMAMPINPAARAGDLGVAGMKMAPTTAERVSIPITRALHDAADAGFKEAAEIPLTVSANAVNNVAGAIRSYLEKEGIRERPTSDTFSILHDLQRPPAGGVVTGENLETVRRSLNMARRSLDPREVAAAERALERFEAWRGSLPAADVLDGAAAASSAAFNTASGNKAAAGRSDRTAGDFDKAAAGANAGANAANSIRQQAGDLLRNRETLLRDFSAEEIGQLQRVADGMVIGNMSGRVAGMLGMNGAPNVASALSNVAGATVGLAVGNQLGFPGLGTAIGATFPSIAGMSLKGIENAIARHQAGALDAMIRKRSPLYQDMQGAAPRNTPSDLRRTGLQRALILERNAAASRGGAQRDDGW